MNTFFIAVSVILLIAAALIISCALFDKETDAAIEIIIDGDKAGEQLEAIALSVRIVADKYLKNADIYIRGGREELAAAVCKVYGMERK